MPTLLKRKPTYTQLLKDVRKTIARGKGRAQAAVEREKVRTSWEVGKHILDFILLNQKRGDYGASVMKRVARDLKISYTETRYMVEFARTYKKSPTSGVLSWGHYRDLLGVNDSKVRGSLVKQATTGNWTVKRLRSEMRERKAGDSSLKRAGMTIKGGYDGERDLEEPKRGKPGVYRTLKAVSGIHQGKLIYDLGFANYYRPKTKTELRKLTQQHQKQRLPFGLYGPKDPKRLRASGARNDDVKKVVSNKSIPETDLYHYETWVTDVIDGDTFWADVHLGFGVTTQQSLRFRKINAPELPSAAAIRAKKYLARKISRKKNPHQNLQVRPV